MVTKSALHQFETGHWAEACRTLYPLVADQPNHYDVPSLTLDRPGRGMPEEPAGKFRPGARFRAQVVRTVREASSELGG